MDLDSIDFDLVFGILLAATPFVFIVCLVLFVRYLTRRGVNRAARLQKSGLHGTALVLSSSQVTNGAMRVGITRYVRRQMVIEVDIPGTAPYQLQDNFLVPRGLVECVPGSLLDVAVNRGNPSDITIVGPGGFSGPWLVVGPPPPY